MKPRGNVILNTPGIKLSGNEILKAAEYVKQHGVNNLYDITDVIPYMNYWYKRFISTDGVAKEDISDISLF